MVSEESSTTPAQEETIEPPQQSQCGCGIEKSSRIVGGSVINPVISLTILLQIF